MALTGKQLQELMQPIQKTGSEILPSIASKVDTKTNTIESLTKQIANTSTRLASVGEDVKKITDTRNPLEKVLNLTPDQNFVFDLFELINRPQQALFGSIEAVAQGGNALEGALTGLTGENKTGFKDVLKAVTKSELGDVAGQVDLVDIAGLAGDVLLDPADLALMFVSGGTSLAGSVVSSGKDLAKSVETGLDIAQIGKGVTSGIGEVTDLVKTANSVYTPLGKVQDLLFGKGKRLVTNLSFEDYVSAVVSSKARTKLGLESASITNMTFKTLGGTAKGITHLGDAMFTNGFKLIDDSGELTKAYDGFKKGYANASSGLGKSIKKQVGLAQEKYNTVMMSLKGVDTRYIDTVKSVAEKNGRDFGELNIKAMDRFEKEYGDNLLDADAFLNFASGKSHSTFYDEATLEDAYAIFGKENIEPYVTVKTLPSGVKYFEYDKNYFDWDNNPEFMQSLADIASKPRPVFDDATRAAYEKTLKYSDEVRFSQYNKKVANYNADLEGRLAKRYTKETGLAINGNSSSTQAWKNIKAKIEAEDLKLGTHPQTMLQDPTLIKDRYNVWMTDDERKSIKKVISQQDLKEYNNYIRRAKKAAGKDSEAIDRTYVKGDEMLRNAKVAIPSGNAYKFTGLNTTQKELAKQINQDIPKNIEESAKKLGLDPLLKSENIELDKKTLENIKNGPYAKETELVNIDELINYADLDRVGANKMNDIGYITNLADDIIANGYKEPILLQVNPKTGYTLVGEGNHRLIIAKAYGIENVPVRVLRSPNLKPMESAAGGYRGGWFVNPNNIKVRNVLDGVKYYYSDMPPSYIGIGKTPSTKKVVSTMSDLEDVAAYKRSVREAMKASGGDADTVERIYIEGDKMLRKAVVGNEYKAIPVESRPIKYDAPIKKGYVRVYHNTPSKNVDSIIKNGIDVEGGNKYRAIKEYEGSGVWVSTQPAKGYGGNTFAFDIPEEEFAKYKVNNTEAIIQRTITPDEFLFVDSTPFLNKGLSEETLRKLEDFGTVFDRTSDVIETNRKIGYDEVLNTVKKRLTNDEEFNKFKNIYDDIIRNSNHVVKSLEDTAYSSKLNNAYRQGRIRMGHIENDVTKAYYDDIMNDDVVKQVSEAYKKSLHEAQRAVGMREFNDAEALIKSGFQGYATHSLSQEASDMFDKIKQAHPEWQDKVDFSMFMPGKTKALAARQMYGSTYETNMFLKEWYGEMFKNDTWVKEQFKDADPAFLEDLNNYFTKTNLLAQESTASIYSFIDDSYSAINKNNKTNQMLLATSVGNVNAPGAAFQVISSTKEIPTGFVPMNKGDVYRTIRTLEENMKYGGENKLTRDLVNALKSTTYNTSTGVPVVEKHIYEMLKATNEAKPQDMLKFIDALNRGFKVGKTLNPAFNVKNITGHMINQWLAGMPISSIFSEWNNAYKVRKEMSLLDDVIIKGGMEALSTEQKALYDTYQEFLDAGFLSRSSIYKLNDLDPNNRWTDPMSSQKQFTMIDNFMTRTNMSINLMNDNAARLGTYMYAKKNPEFITKLGIDATRPDAAMQAVRLIHFDPNDLTFFEDDVMKRLVPFYTFTRQNMAFQIKNLTRHSEKYNKLFKLYNSWNSNVMDLSPEEMQKYQRDQFYVPIWKKENGEYVAVKSSIPVAALSELTFDVKDMTQNIVSKLTPAIRAPFEMATGTQTFTGQPIERYKGELSTRIPLPYMTKGMEWLLSQTGLDVPTAAVAQTVKAGFDIANGASPEQAIYKATNLLGSINPQDNQISKLYNDLDSINARVQVLKSKGIELPTLDELSQNAQGDKASLQLSELQKVNDLINNIKR